jgi:hypothetical protein
MPQWYAYPNATDSESFFTLFRYVNTGVDGVFATGILFVIWAIAILAGKQFGTEKAFTYASFLAFVLALPLAVFGFINPSFMYLFAIFTAVGAVWIKLTRGRI